MVTQILKFPTQHVIQKKSCILDVDSCWNSVFCLLFLLSTSKEAERNNTQVDSLLLNPKRLYHCYSSKNHQCWQFSACFSLVELYISLFARRDSSSTNNPAWQTCRCWQQIGVLYSLSRPSIEGFLLPPLFLFFLFLFCSASQMFSPSICSRSYYNVWKWSRESCCFEDTVRS